MYVALFAIGVALFTLYAKTGRFLRCVFFTAISGLATLGILWAVGKFTSITAVLTPFTLMVSSILGVPGVVAMLLMNLI